jgi:hypothetical protein
LRHNEWRGSSRPNEVGRANCGLRFRGWFTEGFDTRDLKEAKALLEELAQIGALNSAAFL